MLSGDCLHHYRRDLSRPDRPWRRLAVVSGAATGPGRLVRQRGVLLAVVPEAGGEVVYRLGPAGWEPARDVAIPPLVAPEARDAPSAEQLGADSRQLRAVATTTASGWSHALTDEGGSVFGYHRAPGGDWERDSCLRLARVRAVRGGRPESVKLAQVTGDRDATPTPWGERAPTLSRRCATAGVRGTDLGVRVDHAGRSFLLFGDTHWNRRPWLATRDAIAEVRRATSRLPRDCPASVPRVAAEGRWAARPAG